MTISGTGPGRRSGPSIEDVARLAGVSAQTVSRVANGAEAVRPGTRAKVQTAMDQLGYSPNRAARALRSGSFKTIGLIAHRFERTGEALTTEAVLEAAEDEGYSVTLLTVRNTGAGDWESAALRLSHQAIDGLVIIRAEGATPESLALPPQMPVAVSDSRLVGHFPGVVTDQLQGSREATEHLLGLGHRTVHHLAGPPDSAPASLRLAAWRRTLEEAGVSAPAPVRGDWTARSGYEAGCRLADDPAVTAVFCANDEMAMGLMWAMQERGRTVPADVSVVGFDDIAVAGFTSPPLTTVRQDFHRIGQGLVRSVLDQLRATPGYERDRVVVPTELVVRGSTAPPRATMGA